MRSTTKPGKKQPQHDTFQRLTSPLRWPQTLREKVQDYLTIGWTNRLPIIQSIAPCELAAKVLSIVLGSRVSEYVYVDFASGSGGPTPFIEKQLNAQLRQTGQHEVKFVLSDISPHVSAWSALSKKSENLSYISQSIDATNAPDADTMLKDVSVASGAKVMRLFSLAFHHFDDDLAAKVLENTIETADGFWCVHTSPKCSQY